MGCASSQEASEQARGEGYKSDGKPQRPHVPTKKAAASAPAHKSAATGGVRPKSPLTVAHAGGAGTVDRAPIRGPSNGTSRTVASPAFSSSHAGRKEPSALPLKSLGTNRISEPGAPATRASAQQASGMTVAAMPGASTMKVAASASGELPPLMSTTHGERKQSSYQSASSEASQVGEVPPVQEPPEPVATQPSWQQTVGGSTKELDDFVPIEADEEKMERAVHAVRTRVEQSSAASSMISGAWQQMICVLSNLGSGFRFMGRYEMEQGRNFGATAVIAEAIEVRGSRRTPVAVKFFLNSDAYKKESEFYNDIIPNPSLTVAYLDESDDPMLPGSDTRLPPCIVMERGDYTLQEFMRRGKPNRVALKGMLMDVVEAVDEWHQRGLVYRDLKPGNIMFFSQDHRWKLIDVGSWTRAKILAPLSYTLRYAATEVLRAEYEGRAEDHQIENSDMWSLGAVIYEILTGRQLLGYEYSDDHVVKMLVGVQPLPWEENANFFDVINERSARRMLMNLLVRKPELRWTTKRVMSSSFFLGADPTVDKEMTAVAALDRLERGIHQRLEQQQAASEEHFYRMNNKYEESTGAIRSDLKHLSSKAEEILVKVRALECVTVSGLKEASTNTLAVMISFWEVNTGGVDISSQAAMELLEMKPSNVTKAPMESWPKPDPNEPVFMLHIGSAYIMKIEVMRVGADGTKQPLPSIDLQKVVLEPVGSQTPCVLSLASEQAEPSNWTAAAVWTPSKIKAYDPMLQQPSDYLNPVPLEMELHMAMEAGGEEVFTLSKTAFLNMRPKGESLPQQESYSRSQEWWDAAPQWLRTKALTGSIALGKLVGPLGS